jgi:hypothetical protein
MPWRLSAGILALALILLLIVPALGADTGTYGIAEYTVRLDPQADGQVRITVEQIWRVLSGHIPWVTVGLPNSRFQVENYGGDVSDVSSANSGGFSGVRVDLDRDYQPGETFNISFTVLQNNLLERLPDEGVWRINYTPGWYDRATIDHLRIELISPVDYESYATVSPMPADVANTIISWERSNLQPGGRFNIVVESVDGSFLTEPAPSTGLSSATILVIAIGALIVVGLLVYWGVKKAQQATRDQRQVYIIEKEMDEDPEKKKKIEEGFEKYVEKEKLEADAQGRYYDRSYGDYVTPAIWAAIIASQYRQPEIRPGTGTRPGCVSCACVSCACACACACAGGGAAGCSRKTLHQCPACASLVEKHARPAGINNPGR